MESLTYDNSSGPYQTLIYKPEHSITEIRIVTH